MKQWYAVYTRHNWEKKVTEVLTKKQVETYCPLNTVTSQWTDRKKIILKPLFDSYVFVYTGENEHPAIKQTAGVLNLVHWLGRPAIIREAEIDAIKEFLRHHKYISLEKTKVDINDQVRITNGPLMHLEGKVVGIGSRTVKLILPSLGYIMKAEVGIQNIETIGKELSSHSV